LVPRLPKRVAVAFTRKPDGIGRHVLAAFVLSLLVYVGGFWGCTHWRLRRGPWELTFAAGETNGATVTVRQSALGIDEVRLVFPEAQVTNRLPLTIRVATPDDAQGLPFGHVKFLDTTELPGTMTLELFGHEVELLPRVLLLDRVPHPWLPRAEHRLVAPGR